MNININIDININIYIYIYTCMYICVACLHGKDSSLHAYKGPLPRFLPHGLTSRWRTGEPRHFSRI